MRGKFTAVDKLVEDKRTKNVLVVKIVSPDSWAKFCIW